ncbi:hypothetical protein H351_29950 (plasmid) [Rhodococcus erythropolis R138]|nr:hypothetical protein H351_29950 [Rhodococcus erythropolis R138]
MEKGVDPRDRPGVEVLAAGNFEIDDVGTSGRNLFAPRVRLGGSSGILDCALMHWCVPPATKRA